MFTGDLQISGTAMGTKMTNSSKMFMGKLECNLLYITTVKFPKLTAFHKWYWYDVFQKLRQSQRLCSFFQPIPRLFKNHNGTVWFLDTIGTIIDGHIELHQAHWFSSILDVFRYHPPHIFKSVAKGWSHESAVSVWIQIPSFAKI